MRTRKITNDVNKVKNVLFKMQNEGKFKGCNIEYEIFISNYTDGVIFEENSLNWITIYGAKEAQGAVELYDNLAKVMGKSDFLINYENLNEGRMVLLDRKRRKTRDNRTEKILANGTDAYIKFNLRNDGELVLMDISSYYPLEDEFDITEEELKDIIKNKCNIDEDKTKLEENLKEIMHRGSLMKINNISELSNLMDFTNHKPLGVKLEIFAGISDENELYLITNFDCDFDDMLYEGVRIIDGKDIQKGCIEAKKDFKL